MPYFWTKLGKNQWNRINPGSTFIPSSPPATKVNINKGKKLDRTKVHLMMVMKKKNAPFIFPSTKTNQKLASFSKMGGVFFFGYGQFLPIWQHWPSISWNKIGRGWIAQSLTLNLEVSDSLSPTSNSKLGIEWQLSKIMYLVAAVLQVLNRFRSPTRRISNWEFSDFTPVVRTPEWLVLTQI